MIVHTYLVESKIKQVPNRRRTRTRTFRSWYQLDVSRMKNSSVVIVKPGAKVNSGYYCEHLLRRGFLPLIQALCGRHNWTLRQDGISILHIQKYDQLSSAGECYLLQTRQMAAERCDGVGTYQRAPPHLPKWPQRLTRAFSGQLHLTRVMFSAAFFQGSSQLGTTCAHAPM